MPTNPNVTQLDQHQILQRSFDPTQDKLRVDSSVSIESITGVVDVSVKAVEGDNIAIASQDGTQTATLTTNGAHTGLDVNITNTGLPIVVSYPGTIVSKYNETNSVSSGNLTTILTYTVPVGKTGMLQKCEVSGTTIATYTLLINNILMDKKVTMFGGSFNENFLYDLGSRTGLNLNSGDVVTVQVLFNRPSVNDFNARLQTIEI